MLQRPCFPPQCLWGELSSGALCFGCYFVSVLSVGSHGLLSPLELLCREREVENAFCVERFSASQSRGLVVGSQLGLFVVSSMGDLSQKSGRVGKASLTLLQLRPAQVPSMPASKAKMRRRRHKSALKCWARGHIRRHNCSCVPVRPTRCSTTRPCSWVAETPRKPARTNSFGGSHVLRSGRVDVVDVVDVVASGS